MPIITVDDLKTYLNKSSTGDDAELQGFVDAAERMVVQRVGEVSPVAVTEDHYDTNRVVLLDRMPVLSVQTVTTYPGGQVVAEADLVSGVDGWRLDGWSLLMPSPAQMVRVAYTAGRAEVPGNIRLAALELAGHLWRMTQNGQGGGIRPQFNESQPFAPSYAMPYRVLELLHGELLPPVVA